MKTKRNLLKTLGIVIPLSVSTLLSGCGDKEWNYIANPKTTREIQIKDGQTYGGLVRYLTKNCPKFNQKVGEFMCKEEDGIKYVQDFVRRYNIKNGGDKMLIAGKKAYLPWYEDCNCD